MANELYHRHYYSLHYLLHFALLVTNTCHFQLFSTPGSSFRVGWCTTESAAGCIWISASKWHKMRHILYMVISLAQHVVGQRFLAAALMGQRLANGLPATRAPGFCYTYIMHIYPRHLSTELSDILKKMKLGVGDEVCLKGRYRGGFI